MERRENTIPAACHSGDSAEHVARGASSARPWPLGPRVGVFLLQVSAGCRQTPGGKGLKALNVSEHPSSWRPAQ